MIQFTKLRLSGFKSFVDKTELEIGPGLNGIVGPNGCGKSNLVEAMRWVMGETSAKRMRGSGMEDVIFAGTSKRSPRTHAEVSLMLDNTSRQAPSIYNNSNEIEIIRKIERDKGSNYKINSKNARARDVQMLFADTVTGANSPSIVSQGDVTRMINAKPHDRRLILEESAGIAGLYARRHEAELRLKAADGNLERIEDITKSMEARFNALKRQAAQAAKYKNLSAQIRQLELIITYLEWHIVKEKQKENHNIFASAESLVAEKLTSVTQLTKTQNTQIEDIPALRKTETEIAARLQKMKLDFERQGEELERYKNDVQETKTQAHQNNIDLQHEESALEESSSMLEKAEKEYQELLTQQEKDKDTETEKQKAKETLRQHVKALEEEYSALKENAVAQEARKESLERQINRHIEQLDTLNNRRTETQKNKSNIVINENAQTEIKKLESQTSLLEDEIQNLQDKANETHDHIATFDDETSNAREKLSEAEKAHTHITSEISVLEQLFSEESDFETILSQIEAETGFETALARTMGDTLNASLDAAAPTHWQKTETPKQKLPDGAQPLLDVIKAPKELTPALSQIGVVESAEVGKKYAQELKPGQSIVSKDGRYWRWDGYHAQEHAADQSAFYLEQKNKLTALRKGEKTALKKRDAEQKLFENAYERQNRTKTEYDELRAEIYEKEQTLKELRPALQKIKEKSLRIESEQKRYTDQLTSLDEDIASLKETLESDQKHLATLQSSTSEESSKQDAIDELKTTLDKKKDEYQNAVRTFDMFTQSKSTRAARLQAIADERISLKNRTIRAKERLKQLTTRHDSLKEKLEKLLKNPATKTDGQENALNAIADLEKQHSTAIEKLKTQEAEVETTRKALKEAEEILSQAREKRAGAQAMLAALNDQIETMENSVYERLELKPQDLVQHSAVDLVNYQSSDLPKLKNDKDRLTRDRESIGPVNLRAEEEAEELETELTTLLHERQDLTQAVEELRGGINKINKEARARLLAAFKSVDAHFQKLFERLFNGGKAHLKLIDSDDPLGAGLEIFAQPPGKTLQSLSLLSGGEQTLASIALIFGMFLTNPSPICVLDEIDAPLDDSNVDRVCNLLDQISARGETRFLIITHHRISMARMDRLYGVTMAEKGVSQLVSVDLQQSFEFIDKQVA